MVLGNTKYLSYLTMAALAQCGVIEKSRQLTSIEQSVLSPLLFQFPSAVLLFCEQTYRMHYTPVHCRRSRHTPVPMNQVQLLFLVSLP